MRKAAWWTTLQFAISCFVVLALAMGTGLDAGEGRRGPDLGDCQHLRVPKGHKVSYHAYAEGVQIYRWNGTSWTFVAPEAVLYDQDGEVVGIHYGGPTWESNSGSQVKAAVLERCTPDPDAIPWLLLGATYVEGPGPFKRVTYVQRVNTVGGLAPGYNGDFVGEEVEVPYAADYYFYRAK